MISGCVNVHITAFVVISVDSTNQCSKGIRVNVHNVHGNRKEIVIFT